MNNDERLIVYERLLHEIHFASSVTMNAQRMQAILTIISRWSYAHRCGNGCLNPEDQETLIHEAFEEMRKFVS